HISDNGLPIPSEIVPQLFVPFFSTKKEGSGIGLSLSRYIMRLHGGSLRYTQENEWTTFTLIFPNTATTITEQKQLTNT
ncbi:MAG: ATP-binding protein, partial [Massilibacteroides sp.]|nr:ATP-binding protein [Massilibacteroides sp.]